jgi:hypothetical protein
MVDPSRSKMARQGAEGPTHQGSRARSPEELIDRVKRGGVMSR